MTNKDNKSVVKAPEEAAAVGPYATMRRSMDEMMGRMLREWPSFDVFESLRTDKGFGLPSMDLAESDKAYEMTVELPGMDEKDVKVEVEGDVLAITAEHVEERDETKKTWHVTERRRGALRRTLRLPQDIDRGAIAARFSRGVLTVELPKGAKTAKSQRIEIKAS